MKKETRDLVIFGMVIFGGWLFLYDQLWRKSDLFLKPHERFTRYAQQPGQQPQDQQQNFQS